MRCFEYSRMFGVVAVAGGLMLAGSSAEAGQVMIDDFNAAGTVEVDDFANGAQTEEGEDWAQLSGGSPLGDSRDIGVIEDSDNGNQASGISAGLDNSGTGDEYFLEQGAGVQGRAWIQWDGDDSGEGSPEFSDVSTDNLNIDLVDGTNDAIQFGGIDNDSADNHATLQVFVGGDVWRNTQSLPQQNTQTSFDFADFTGGSGDVSVAFQDVSAIQLTFHGQDGSSSALPSANDFSIGAVQAEGDLQVVPTPGALGGGLALFALMGSSAAFRRPAPVANSVSG